MNNKFFFSLLLFLLSFIILPSNAGSINVNANTSGGSATIQFEVPFPQAFVRNIIFDDKLYTRLLAGMKKWQVVKREGENKQIARCTMSISRFMPASNYTVEAKKVSADEVRFKRISGDLDHLDGYWKISKGSKDNSTLVSYSYTVDTGSFHFSKNLVERELKRNLKETEQRVQTELRRIYFNEKTQNN